MNRKNVFAGLVLMSILTACGGGGGGGNSVGTSSGQTSSPGGTVSNSGEASSSSSGSSSSGGTSSSSSSSGGFTPDAGSTMAVGDGREGVWLSSTLSGVQQIMIVDNVDNFFFTGSTSDVSNGNITGLFSDLGSNLWTVGSGVYMPPAQSDGTFPAPLTVTGFLTLAANSAFAGHFDYGTPQQDISVAFSYYKTGVHEANARAVTQDSLTAQWASSNVSIQINSKGIINGITQGTTLGNCALSGTITQIDPGVAKKNLFSIAVAATQTSSGSICKLKMTGESYKGLASILIAGTTQQLIFLSKLSDSSYFNSGSLARQ